MDEILFEVATLLEENIQVTLKQPYVVRAKNGSTKTIGGPVRISPSVSNTGNLASQTSVKVESFDDGVALVVDFGGAENYAYFVENGRRAGKGAPPNVIDRWIRERGLPQFRDKKGRFISNKTRSFLVNRSIKEHGYSGRFFLKKALEMSIKTIEEKYGQAAEQFVLDYFESTGILGEYYNTKTQERFQTRIL